MIVLSISGSPRIDFVSGKLYLEPEMNVRTDGCSLGECDSSNREVIMYPHLNCSKYCLCNWGRYHEMDCPPTLYFNSKISNCDLPQNSDCTPLEYFLDSKHH